MTVKEKAYAKINLYLDVLGQRADGYHDVDTLMQSVSLCDDLTISATPSDVVEIKILSSDKTLETGKNNLIYKSALKYMSKFGITARVDVNLVKRIPIGAGLGGGSADAAATLRAMNRIFSLATKEQLLSMAAELGSDVSFLIDGGCAVCSGRGEKLSPVQYNFPSHFVIAIGKERVSTPEAYALLDKKYGDFNDHNKDMAALKQENLPIYNIFESVICLSEIDEIKKILKENGAGYTLMSGSGPSVFGIFDSAEATEVACAALEKHGFFAFQCNKV